MKKIYSIFLITLCLAAGCNPDDKPAVKEDAKLTLDTKTVNFPSQDADDPNAETLQSIVNVEANCSWDSKIVYSAGEGWLELTPNEMLNISGTSQTAEVVIKVQKNTTSAAREATVTFYYDEDKTQTLKVAQEGKKLYLEATCDNTKVDYRGGSCTVNVSCNGSWTASLAEASSAEVSLSANSGEGDGTISLTFAPNASTTETKTAELIVSCGDCSPVSISFTQDVKIVTELIIGFDLFDYNPEGTSAKPYNFTWPFTSPALTDVPSSVSTKTLAGKETEFTTQDNYVYKIYGREYSTKGGGIWKNSSKHGLCFGLCIGDYIQFPAIEGKRLVKVIAEPAPFAKVAYVIRKAEAGVEPENQGYVTGGEKWESSGSSATVVDKETMENHTFTLTGTQVNTPYRLTIEINASANIKELTLVYDE